jgi:hypothetical protein
VAGSCRCAQWTQGPSPQPSTETQSCSPGSRLSGSYRICTRRPGMAQLPWFMQPARAHGGLRRVPVVRFTDAYSLRSAVCNKSWCVLFLWQPRDAATKVYAVSARFWERGGPPLQGCGCIKLALCNLLFARKLQHYWSHWQPTALPVAGFARLQNLCEHILSQSQVPLFYFASDTRRNALGPLAQGCIVRSKERRYSPGHRITQSG